MKNLYWKVVSTHVLIWGIKPFLFWVALDEEVHQCLRCLQCLCSDTEAWDLDSEMVICLHTPDTPPLHTNKHTHCVSTLAPLVSALHVADSLKSIPAQINNGAKEAFSCRSTPSTPNTKVDDSAVRCPLSTAHAGVVQARPVGATHVKAWNSVLLTAHFLLCPLQSQSTQGESSKHPYILISSSARCHVYLSRSWLEWTVIRYAAKPLCRTCKHTQTHGHETLASRPSSVRSPHRHTLPVSLSRVAHAVTKIIQQQSVWFPCSLSLFILISSGIIAVAHKEFW